MLNRRQMLQQAGAGFGMVGLAGVLNGLEAGEAMPLVPQSVPHFAPKAKNVIFLHMVGAPSQLDLFEPKPVLQKYGVFKFSSYDTVKNYYNSVQLKLVRVLRQVLSNTSSGVLHARITFIPTRRANFAVLFVEVKRVNHT